MGATLAVIGFGSMGSAVVRGAIAASVLKAGEIIVIEPDHDRRQEASELGCVTAGTVAFAIDAEQLMLSVKPQVFPRLAADLGRVPGERIVISIMAGLSSAVIRRALGSLARVVRVMPNTPCRIGAGISAIALGENAREEDAHLARRIFSAVGSVVDVDESHMDAVTALSGSGPAYAFLLAESMEQAGIQLGLTPLIARRLAYHTVLGAGRLLTESPDHVHAETLRTQVTSPGGTTAAALEEMFEREFPQIVIDAIHAARDRGMMLDESQ